MRKNRGFTLIELLITISIIGIVFGVVASSAGRIRQSGRDAQRQSDLRLIQNALQQYYTDFNYYPVSLTLTSSVNITNCTGLTGCTITKTYYTNTPTDPTPGTTTPYVYTAYTDRTATSTCTNATVATQCQYFVLCTNTEGPPPTSTYTQCAAINAGYDFQINP